MAPAQLDEQTGQAARAFLQRIGSRYDIVAAILFGSRARHTHQPDSDADVAVLLRGTPGAFVSTKLDMADSAYDVLLETGIRIQPLPIWEEEWAHPVDYPNPRLLESIRREGVPLFLGQLSGKARAFLASSLLIWEPLRWR